jgi:hypothetical protein
MPTGLSSWTLVALVEFSEDQGLASVVRRVLSQRTTIADQPDWTLTQLGLSSQFADERVSGVIAGPTQVTTAAARTALLTVEVSGEGSLLAGRINGTILFGTNTLEEIDQGGPYAIGATPRLIPGAFTTIGGGRPNSTSQIVNVGDVIVRIDDSSFSQPERETIDGRKTEGGVSLFSASVGGASFNVNNLSFEMPTAFTFDTVVVYVEGTAGNPVVVQVGNSADFSTNEFDLQRSIPSGAGTHRLVFPVPSPNDFQFVRVRRPGNLPVTVHEVELRLQNVRDADRGAEFNLAECIVFQGTNNTTIQQVEGYVAHRWGVAHTLDPVHPRAGAGNFLTGPGNTSADQNSALVSALIQSPLPLLVKYGTSGEPLAAYAGAGVGAGAVVTNEHVYAVGESRPLGPDFVPGDPLAPLNDKSSLVKFRDDQREFVTVGTISDTEFMVSREPIRLEAGPCSSVFIGTREGIRRIDGLIPKQDYLFSSVNPVFRAVPAGLQLDATLQGGDCGPEFLYVAQGGFAGASRVDTLGLTDTGRDAGRDTELLVVTSAGDVLRRVGDDWDTVEAGALKGRRPASATLSGRTFFADGIGYRVYDHQLRQLRDFEEAVSGDFPPRCRFIAAYRGRLVLAGGDNAFTIFQSRFGDPFDFEFGVEIQSIAQAVAGTTSSQGSIPEPVTALMPWRNEVLFVGTSESLWAITGDLADGGRLDHIDKSQGVAPGYAWCESPRGIYYFSNRGGVMLISGSFPVPVSRAIERRLEEVDLSANSIEMRYNWIDKTVHVFVVPNSLGSVTEHFVYCEESGAWFVDDFGDGFERSITGAESLIGDTPEDRTLILGMADGQVYRWDQYAGNDAGRDVRSSAVVGPLVPSAQATELRVRGFHAELNSVQGGIRVATRASEAADAMGPPSEFRELRPGRGDGVPLGASAPAVFIEVQGLGSAWSIHEARVEVERVGEARRMR